MKKIVIIALLLAFPLKAHAVVATVTNVFYPGEKIVSSMMNTNFNDILTVVNGELDDTNMAIGGLSNVSIATASVSGDRLIDDTVAASKILDGPYSVSTHSTAQIDSIQAQHTISNATATVTSRGKRLAFGMLGAPDAVVLSSSAAAGLILESASATPTTAFASIFAYIDGVKVGSYSLDYGFTQTSASMFIQIPCSSIYGQVAGFSSGSHTLTFQATASASAPNTSATLVVNYCQAYLMEQ